MTGHLTAAQVDYLLRQIQPQRVSRVDGQSYLPQQDVRAHLTRVFGFGGWSSAVTDSSLIFDEHVSWEDKRSGKPKSGWDCAYRARVRLTVRDPEGVEVAQYEDEATGDASHQPTRAAAHDLALKSAVSTALKRAATSLGDQFGLSLYNKGSMDQFVIFTLAKPKPQSDPWNPETPAAEPVDVPAATEEEEAPVAEAAVVDAVNAIPQPDGDPETAPVSVSRPADTPPEEHRENARAYANRQHAQHGPGGHDRVDVPAEPPSLEEALAKAQAAQEHRNGQRRGPEINVAKARAMDGVHYARPALKWEEALDVIRLTLADQFEPDVTIETAEPWQYNAVAALFEAEQLDHIREAYAHD